MKNWDPIHPGCILQSIVENTVILKYLFPMKLFLLSLVLASSLLYANCGTIECYSPCAHGKVSLEGDKCSVTWNEEAKCFEAYAECGDSKKCLGALCYSYCEGKDHYYAKANSCKDYFDPAKSCWGSYGKCE